MKPNKSQLVKPCHKHGGSQLKVLMMMMRQELAGLNAVGRTRIVFNLFFKTKCCQTRGPQLQSRSFLIIFDMANVLSVLSVRFVGFV
jgi:hypothetical protein